jgi:hypothetical protein
LPKWFDRTTNEYCNDNGESRHFEILIRPKKQRVIMRELEIEEKK